MLWPWAPHTHDVRTTRAGAWVDLVLAAQLRAAVRPTAGSGGPTRTYGVGLGAVEHVVGATRARRGRRPAGRRRPPSATPSALMRKARSGSRSQASTAVHAPALSDDVGRGAGDRLVAPSRGRRGRASARSHAMTSSPASVQVRTRSWPSWPPAPVIEDAHQPARLQRAPPPLVGAVPVDGGLERLVERALLRPPERGDLGDVDRVAAVVAEAVLDVLDRRLVLAEQREELVDEHPVGRLVAGADVVDLAGRALVEHEVDAGAVVVDVEPVALVEAVAVERDRAAVEQVGGEQRDGLLGVLVRPEVVGAAGDGDRQRRGCGGS